MSETTAPSPLRGFLSKTAKQIWSKDLRIAYTVPVLDTTVRDRMTGLIHQIDLDEAVRHQRPTHGAGEGRHAAFKVGAAEGGAAGAKGATKGLQHDRGKFAKALRAARDFVTKKGKTSSETRKTAKGHEAFKDLGARSRLLHSARVGKQLKKGASPEAQKAIDRGIASAVKGAKEAHRSLMAKKRGMTGSQKADYKKSVEDPVGAAHKAKSQASKKPAKPPTLPSKREQHLTHRLEKAARHKGNADIVTKLKSKVAAFKQARLSGKPPPLPKSSSLRLRKSKAA